MEPSVADDIAASVSVRERLQPDDPTVGDLDQGVDYLLALEGWARRTPVAAGGGRSGFVAALRRRVAPGTGLGTSYSGSAAKFLHWHREMRIHDCFPEGYAH